MIDTCDSEMCVSGGGCARVVYVSLAVWGRTWLIEGQRNIEEAKCCLERGGSVASTSARRLGVGDERKLDGPDSLDLWLSDSNMAGLENEVKAGREMRSESQLPSASLLVSMKPALDPLHMTSIREFVQVSCRSPQLVCLWISIWYLYRKPASIALSPTFLDGYVICVSPKHATPF
ncbi:hypothetical protein Tco_1448927 [Tanacetum coccineum]